MMRCSERAFAMCPHRHECGTIHEATFTDGSECDEFNRRVDEMPMTNADKIRAMDDETLATQFAQVVSEVVVVMTRIQLPDEILNELRTEFLNTLKKPVEVE